MQTVSMQATRSHPWEPWVEPLPKASYWGVTVGVVDWGNQLAIVELAGHRMLVEVADLKWSAK
jgi:hypothetical protein